MKHTGTFLLLFILIPLLAFTIASIKKYQEKKTVPTAKSINTSSLGCPNCNVILIGIDTLRADHLSSYGYSRKTSPNIDKLAEKGVLFKNAYSQSGKTTPAFMSILSSLYVSDHGIRSTLSSTGKNVNFYRIHDSIQTLPQILKNHGYKTYGFITSNQLPKEAGFDRGFDYYKEDSYWGHRETVLKMIPDIKKQGKFFIFFHDMEPHEPYLPPGPYDTLFDPDYKGSVGNKKLLEYPKDFEVGLNDSQQEKKRKGEAIHIYTSMKFWSTVNKDDPRDVYHLSALYDGEIAHLDLFIKRLYDSLKEHDLLKKTIIVFTADHGEEFKEHGEFDHIQLYNEIIHVPLIITWPGIEKKTVINQNVRTIDIMPTLFELLNISFNTPIRGSSLLGFLDGSTKEDRDVVSQQFEDSEVFIHKNDKYIRQVTQNKKDELYNLAKDPEEKVNLAIKDIKKAEEMRQALRKTTGAGKYIKIPTPITIQLGDVDLDKLKSLGY